MPLRLSIPRFFSEGPAGDDYAFNRDDPGRQDVRDYCEEAWARYAPLNGDQHFLSDARHNFHARTWEMLLACTLLDVGLELEKPPADGPDTKIVSSEGAVWVEAVTVELGTGANSSARIETGTINGITMFHPQHEKTVMRYTGALHGKRQQLLQFRERGIVHETDPFVIAVNGGLLHDYSSERLDPAILKAVYPIGEAYLRIPLYSDAPEETGWHYRDSLEKPNGAPVATTAFASDEYNGVSAVLFSMTTAWNSQPQRANYMSLIHNPRAAAPVAQGFFPFGRETVLQDGELSWLSHSGAAHRT